MSEAKETKSEQEAVDVFDGEHAYQTLTDDYINGLFEGTNFGEPVNSCVEEKRKLILKTLRNQLEGFWCGHTAYNIAVYGGFLIDAKSGATKRLTALGKAFIENDGR